MSLILSGTDGVSDIDGTAATPAIRGTDANTGIFFPSADTIAFAEGGAEAMRIDSSGNVSIGATSSSSQAFRVSQTAFPNVPSGWYANAGDGNAEQYGITRVDATNGRGIRFQTTLDGSNLPYYSISTGTAASTIAGMTWTERMRIDSSGNVGIGTTSPAGRLDVRSTYVSDTTVQVRFGDNTGGFLDFGGTAGANKWINASDGSTTAYPLAFQTGGTERARITSGGYFKASNSGSYVSSTGAYHEVVSNANDMTFYAYNSNASYTETIFRPVCARSATNLYNFLLAYSAWTGTPDIEFNLRGDGNGYADGTWNNNGADYAEFFESANGQALTLGATVVLDGTKVREATDQDPASAIIGVVRPKEPSKASMVVGNTAWNKWANKYLTDDFDRYIMEDHDVVEWEEQVLEREAVAAVEAVVDEEGNEVSPAIPAQEAVYKTKQHSYESHNIPAGVTVPADAVRKTHDDKGNKFQHYKLNPAWDKDAEYVNRENRPEWNIIGLLGQVKILKGQPVGDRWIKMRDVSATVEEWMIR